jgi:hypothetical protein
MPLNSSYVTAPSLEEYFVDKTTGLPLAGGKVYFYSDINRSLLKNIYTLSGNAPNYSYVELPNPSTLSGVGTFQDEGSNNVLPYYYPYDADGNIENYYIEVYNSSAVLQFSREGFPNLSGSSSDIDIANAINYIPNGQFLLHNNIPEDTLNDIPSGQIVSDVTNIAQGGWSFERSSGSSSIDNVSFFKYGEYVDDPSASPRFSCKITCSSPDISTTDKGLYLKFADVNKFSSDADQTYTYSFSAETVNSGDFTVTLNLIKFFGTGGIPSPTEISALTTFEITSSQNTYQFSFTFGDNDGKSIGTSGDDYVALELSFPTNISYGAIYTNFLLLIGTLQITEFPPTTDNDFSVRSLAPPVPDHDGNDLGLPMLATLIGVEYDHDVVGDITDSISSEKKWHHLCDGRQLLTSGYQTTGVPNSRLQSKLFDATRSLPMFGTGASFITGLNLSSGYICLHNNTLGAVSATADGTVATGFTFSQIHIGDAGYGVTSFWYTPSDLTPDIGNFVIWNTAFGSVTAVGLGTSGFTINSTIRKGSTLTAQITNITPTVATSLAGKYFTFNTVSTAYYVWFKVDGTGTDPAVAARTGILVNLRSTDTQTVVSQKISNSLNGFEVSQILTTVASTIPAGSYFNFTCIGGATTAYYVWYKKDGAGTDPSPAGRVGIMVSILTADTAEEVAFKTILAINSMYFAVPDFRGQTLRMLDKPDNYDLGLRFSLYSDNLTGLRLGTFEMDSNLSHSHPYEKYSVLLPQTGDSTNCWANTATGETGFAGATESVGYNAAVNFFIHY